MKTWLVCTLLLACAVSASLACTAETCAGPVVLTFATADCSGSPSSITELVSNSSWVNNPYACLANSNETTMIYRCEEGFYTETYFADNECYNLDHHVITKTSLCYKEGGAYKITLCNVNTTYAASSTASNAAAPEYQLPGEEACSKHYNCTEQKSIMWYTTSDDSNAEACRGNLTEVIGTWGYAKTEHFAWEKCLYSTPELSNMKLQCSRYLMTTNLYQNGDNTDCSGQPWRQIMKSKSCQAQLGAKRASRTTIEWDCDEEDDSPAVSPSDNTPPTNSSEPVHSPNAAGRTTPAATAIALVLVAALFAAFH